MLGRSLIDSACSLKYFEGILTDEQSRNTRPNTMANLPGQSCTIHLSINLTKRPIQKPETLRKTVMLDWKGSVVAVTTTEIPQTRIGRIWLHDSSESQNEDVTAAATEG